MDDEPDTAEEQTRPEGQDRPDDQSAAEPERAEEELQELSARELQAVLEEHREWVETKSGKGELAGLQEAYLAFAKLQEAELRGANLQRANLQMADLRKAKLMWAKLQGADLQGADLQGADLQGADLMGANLEAGVVKKEREPDFELAPADLTAADLRNADLSDAKLSSVTGLLSGKLAGANLSNAKIPEKIEKFEGLDYVAETSQNARKIFFGLLLACVYSWLTIATTTDVGLLTNSSSSPLPIIGTEIPIAWFYRAAPLLLLAVYFYLHLYLQRLWEALAKLPAIFPDGQALHERAYPWLLNGLVRAHFMRLKSKRPTVS
jgi:hypothetical protein